MLGLESSCRSKQQALQKQAVAGNDCSSQGYQVPKKQTMWLPALRYGSCGITPVKTAGFSKVAEAGNDLPKLEGHQVPILASTLRWICGA